MPLRKYWRWTPRALLKLIRENARKILPRRGEAVQFCVKGAFRGGKKSAKTTKAENFKEIFFFFFRPVAALNVSRVRFATALQMSPIITRTSDTRERERET